MRGGFIEWNGEFIDPDRTPKEQEKHKALRQELKRRKNAGENVKSRNGKILTSHEKLVNLILNFYRIYLYIDYTAQTRCTIIFKSLISFGFRKTLLMQLRRQILSGDQLDRLASLIAC